MLVHTATHSAAPIALKIRKRAQQMRGFRVDVFQGRSPCQSKSDRPRAAVRRGGASLTRWASAPPMPFYDATGARATLTKPAPDPFDALARELDGICNAVRADLGARDRAYITRVIRTQRQLELAGRALLLGARFAPVALAGTALLSVAKIVENMEIGHNVLHGQWDWMGQPHHSSRAWESAA